MCSGTHDYIEVPNTAMIEFLQSYGGQTIENVLYFNHAGGWGTTELGDLLGAMLDAATDNMPPLHDEGWSLISVRATDVRTQTGIVLEASEGLPVSGSHAASGGMAGNAALVTTFKTVKRGRSYRGRAYTGGLPNVYDPDNNHVSTTYANLVSDMWAAIQAAAADSSWAHVIVSRCQGGSWLSTAVVTAVASYETNLEIDSQRRRLAGRGA